MLHTYNLQPRRPSWGIRAEARKAESTGHAIVIAPPPREVAISLNQSAGRPAVPIVEPGEKVSTGQPVARATAPGSADIHASISGLVVAVEERLVFSAHHSMETAIVIRGDGTDEDFTPHPVANDPMSMTPAEIRQTIAGAGIVGLGGAMFPTAEKLSCGARIHALILNGVECEPYISCDEVLLRYRAARVLRGAQILMRAAGTQRCIVAVETDMPEARVAVHEALETLNDDRIDVSQVTAKYPSGGERQVLELITGRQVPSGGLPQDIGYLCQNVGTAAAVADFFATGRPLISRIVTVTGQGVSRPVNIEARIGTPIAELIAMAGGYRGTPAKLIAGGPMMGIALPDDGIPISKANNCIIAAAPGELMETAAEHQPELPCIRCSECLQACPAGLQPQELLVACRQQDRQALESLGLPDCLECGCCDYVCPSAIPLTARFSLAKIGFRQAQLEERRALHARQRFEAREARLQQQAVQREHELQEQSAGVVSDSQIDAVMARVARDKNADTEKP